MASFATSYIPTTTAAVTRSADLASISGSNYSSWAGSSEFTIYAEAFRQTAITSQVSILGFSDGTLANRFSFRQDNASQAVVISVTGSNLDASPLVTLNGVLSPNRIAASFTSNNLNTAANGVLGGVDTSVAFPPVNRLDVGGLAAAPAYTGWIRRLTYWPQALPSRLQSITQ